MVKVFVSHSTSLQAKYAFTPKDAADLHVLVASSRHFGPDGSLEEDGVGVGDAHELQEHAQYPPTGNPLASLSGEEQEVHDGLQAAGIRHPHRFQPFLKNLHRAFYRTSDDFKGATREGLNQAGLVNVLGLVDAIMECQAAAATTSAGTSAASPGDVAQLCQAVRDSGERTVQAVYDVGERTFALLREVIAVQLDVQVCPSGVN